MIKEQLNPELEKYEWLNDPTKAKRKPGVIQPGLGGGDSGVIAANGSDLYDKSVNPLTQEELDQIQQTELFLRTQGIKTNSHLARYIKTDVKAEELDFLTKADLEKKKGFLTGGPHIEEAIIDNPDIDPELKALLEWDGVDIRKRDVDNWVYTPVSDSSISVQIAPGLIGEVELPDNIGQSFKQFVERTEAGFIQSDVVDTEKELNDVEKLMAELEVKRAALKEKRELESQKSRSLPEHKVVNPDEDFFNA